MNAKEFKRVCKNHGIFYSGGELASAAYEMAVNFLSWEAWVAEITTVFSGEEIAKLVAATAAVLKTLPSDAEGYRSGVVTSEQRSTVSK